MKEKTETAVEAHQDEALALLQTMVRIPSLAGQEKDVQMVVEQKMRAVNLQVDVWDPPDEILAAHPAFVPVDMSYRGRPNVVGVFRGTGGGRSLILNGHVDVVPTGPQELWTYSPWSGHYQDGRVYGRGSSDMKAGVVANLLAVQALHTAGIRLKGDLIVE